MTRHHTGRKSKHWQSDAVTTISTSTPRRQKNSSLTSGRQGPHYTQAWTLTGKKWNGSTNSLDYTSEDLGRTVNTIHIIKKANRECPDVWCSMPAAVHMKKKTNCSGSTRLVQQDLALHCHALRRSTWAGSSDGPQRSTMTPPTQDILYSPASPLAESPHQQTEE